MFAHQVPIKMLRVFASNQFFNPLNVLKESFLIKFKGVYLVQMDVHNAKILILVQNAHKMAAYHKEINVSLNVETV